MWALLELHRIEEDAWAAYRPADGATALFDGATERWSAVLEPFSHRRIAFAAREGTNGVRPLASSGRP